MYNRVESGVLDELRQIVGADNVLDSGEALESYAHDETVGLRALRRQRTCLPFCGWRSASVSRSRHAVEGTG